MNLLTRLGRNDEADVEGAENEQEGGEYDSRPEGGCEARSEERSVMRDAGATKGKNGGEAPAGGTLSSSGDDLNAVL